jgi:hypothetical protein
MSKNLTRKGLAFGALVALGSTVIAGAPAYAAGELNLQPATGTTYGTIIGETFKLSVNTNPGYAAGDIVKLKYNVTNAGKAALTLTAGAEDGSYTNGTAVNAGAADNSNYVVTPTETSTSVANVITVATAATSTSTVGIQAWIDADLDNVIDANEWTSSVQSVVFNKASEVTWTTEFTAPAIGDTKFTALVSAAPSINLAQIANANLGVRFGKNATDAGEQFVAKSAATFDSATNKLKFNPSIALVADAALASPVAIANNATAVAGGFRYDAQAAYLAAGLGTGASLVAEANLVGSQVAYAVAAATIGSIEAPATTASDDLVVATAPVAGSTAGATTVRASATKVPVSILVKDGSAAALKDTAVTVYIQEKATGGTDTNATTAVGNFDASTFTAGGVTLKDTSANAEVVSFAATTNADGKVIFDLTASAKAGDGVTIWASAQGVNVNGAAAGAVSTATNRTVYTWTTEAPASVVNNNVAGTSAVLKQAAGSTFTLNYTVIDQFGAAIPTADKYRVVISDGTNSYYPVVSAGKASQSITLSSTATGTLSYSSTVQAKGTDGNYANITPSSITGAAVSVVVGASNAASNFTALSDITTAGTVTAALSTTAANTIALSTRSAILDTVAFVAGDKNAGATNSVKGTLTTGVLLAGQVTDATTAGTYSTVTFSGTNLNFVVGSALYAAGTVTVQTDASGNYAGIRVLSNKSGKQTLTITAGSVSKSYVLDFGAAAATAGKTLTVDAPATAVPGTTILVTAKLVDAFGNGVDLAATHASVTYTGPGLIVGSLPNETDANGELSFRVLLGASDTGTATVVVKASNDADTTFDETGDSAVTKTISIAAPVVVVPEVKTTIVGVTKAIRVRVENAKGEEVEIVVNGRTVAVATAGTNSKLWVLKSTKGKKSVKVYVDGDLVAVKTVTVK